MQLDYSLRGLLASLFRQQVKIIVTAGLVVAVGLFFLLTMGKTYESHGSLLVNFAQNTRADLVAGANRGPDMTSSDHDEIIHSNVSIIYSQDLLRSVIADFGIDRLYPEIAASNNGVDTPMNMAIKRLAGKDLIVQPGSRNNIIDIAVRNQDPQVAADFAARLMDGFIRRQSEIYNKPQTGFLDQQVLDAAKKLQDSQHDLQVFKQQNNISDLDEEMNQLLRQKTDLSGIAYEAVTKAQSDLAELESKQAEMQATYRGNSPAMQRMNEMVAAARDQVRQRQSDLNNAEQSSTSSLASKLAEIDKRIAYLEQHRAAYTELRQRVDIGLDNYKYYQQRSEEARANDILNQQNITRISIVDAPSVSAQPVDRHRKVLLIAVLMTAGLFGLAIAFLFELLDDRLRTPAQLASRLRLPVLATFSQKGA